MKINRGTLITVLTFLGLFTLTVLYLQNIFLPTKAREIISQRSKDLIRRDLSIGQIDYSLLKGFVLKNIKLSEKDAPGAEFISAEEISFQVLLPALFKSKKIIIPSISLKKPHISVTRYTDRSFNFSDIIEKFSGSSSSRSPVPILLGDFSLTEGQISFMDQKPEGDYKKELVNIDLKAALSLPAMVNFSISSQVREDTGPFPAIAIQGKYHFTDRKLTAAAQISEMPSLYSRVFLPKEQTAKFEFSINTADLSLTAQQNQLSITGKMDLNGPQFHLPAGTVFAKNLKISQFKLRKDAEAWHLEGDWSGEGAYFQAKDSDIPQQFDIAASGFIFDKDLSRTQVKGDFIVNNILADLKPGPKISGSLTLNDAAVFFDGMTLDIAAALASKEIHWKFMDTTFDGALDSPLAHLRSENGAFNLDGRFNIKTSRINIEDKIQVSGDLSSAVSVQKALDGPPVYRAEVNFLRTDINGVPRIGSLSGIQGTAVLSNDRFETQEMSFDMLGSAFTVTGTLENFKDLQADIRFRSDNADLEQMTALIAATDENVKISAAGSAAVEGRFRGKTAEARDAQVNLTAVFKGASLQGQPLPFPIFNITGTVSGDNNNLAFENFKGTVQKNDYTLNGTLKDFKNPALDITIVSSNINVTSDFRISGDPEIPGEKTITINSLRGYYLNTPLNVRGSIALKQGTQQLNLEGHTDLELKDLSVLLPQMAEKLKTINPSGLLKTDFRVQGPAGDWRDLLLSVSGQSPEIFLWGLRFSALDLKFSQKNKKIEECSLNSKLYDGNMSISSTADLQDEDIPFDLTAALENTDLEKLKNDSELKNRPLSGKLFGSLELSGHLKDGSGLTGEGTLTAKDGNLAQMTIFKGLINAMLPKEFQTVNFTYGTMGFEVGERKVATTNLTLISDQVTLMGRGSIDFDKNIDFLIEPKFSEIALAESQSLTTPVASVMNIANQFVDMEVTGTLSKPVFTPKPRPGKVINKVKDALIDGLENIFQ